MSDDWIGDSRLNFRLSQQSRFIELPGDEILSGWTSDRPTPETVSLGVESLKLDLCAMKIQRSSAWSLVNLLCLRGRVQSLHTEL